MNTSRKRLLSAALATVFALAPGTAGAEDVEVGVVPPENSAVNQYTEAFPTAGGERNVHEHKGRRTSPNRALGAKTTRKLEQQGRAGREVAELATETAPAIETSAPDAEAPDSAAREKRRSEATGGGGADGGNAGGGSAGIGQAGGAQPAVDLSETGGSSGLGSVVANAFGFSPDGGAGLLLLMLATIAWALAYAARQRRAVG